MPEPKKIFRIEHLSVTIEHALVLEDLSLSLESGEMYYLIGDRNSGKSVLACILRGNFPRSHYQGEIFLENTPISSLSCKQREDLGIRVLSQNSAFVPGMTLAENLFLGNEIHSIGVLRWHRIFKETIRILNEIQWDISPSILLKNIPKDKLYLVSLAKGFLSPTKVFIIDEAFTHLDIYVESQRKIASILERLKEKGVAILYLNHKIDNTMSIANRVGVLKEGKIAYESDARQTIPENLVYKLLGEPEENPEIPPSVIKKYNLTPRETEIMRLLFEGMNARQISETLYISLSTVKTHIYNIYQKTGVKNRLALARLCSLK
ncbi:LuxR C-terminal-related transcriptional regulator [Thermospira aquatica]|uniref:ATP-binding cassette domain-containing protein n=1 Tax=Thermospira aquatica TaxID=2828656 RepID=A0AAX3BG99_9SPIR|nr:LuxR C-terminal-related transcriptional regulator [Thermospira aquatica]URA11185.1 ATP-binding cassette domain-containing protein [Thermospira aquatica]